MISQLEVSSSSSSISSSCAPIQSWTNHVFLSFRGEDTRNTFTGHLRNYLVHRGIRTFMDNDLPRGEEISSSLFKAIEESKISVIVFSEKYASSKWCLDELVKIMQCQSKGQIVYPIFYKVDPRDVRKQSGTFGLALEDHDNSDKVMGWREALTKAGHLCGWHFLQGQDESAFILKVVKKISQQVLDLTCLTGDKFLVGIESRLGNMCKLLRVGERDVEMVGIWGTGGSGKTTIAQAVYDRIAHNFEGCCFMYNVRKKSSSLGGLEKLQMFLLTKTLGLKGLEINSIDEGSSMIKEMLSHRRVLLVLDDVSDVYQLNSLVRNSNWFGSGSRIIITTRAQDLLQRLDVITYEVETLTNSEALELFKFNAFKEKEFRIEYIQLIDSVIRYADGLPLVLEVLGSHLHGRCTDTWEDAIKCFERGPKLHDRFKLSYDALDPLVREVFLHIACFFKGEKENYVMDILEGCGLPKCGIDVLIKRSLIKITEAKDIWMHDLLEEMGKEIVMQESTKPGERSRLWRYEDVEDVFVNNTGTNKVKGIMVKKGIYIPHHQIPLNSKSFFKLTGLQILQISANIFCGNHVDCLPEKLSLLDWDDCPLQYFPPKFHLSKLVVLKMEFSSKPRFWSGQTTTLLYVALIMLLELMTKVFPFGFKVIEERFQRYVDGTVQPTCSSIALMECTNVGPQPMGFLKSNQRALVYFLFYLLVSKADFLCKMPWICISPFGKGLQIMQSLKSIKLVNCDGLTNISNLSKFCNLVELKLRDCRNVVEVDISIGFEKLVNLEVSGKVTKFEIVKEMKSLKRLDLSETAISKLSSSTVGYLMNLEQLTLMSCKKLEDVPCNIFELQHLQLLDLSFCDMLVTVPTKSEFSTELTSSQDKHYVPLFVDLKCCRHLVKIIEFPREICRLDVRNCFRLERISKLSDILEGEESRMIPQIYLSGCISLYPNLARDVSEMKENLPDNSELTALFYLFFSCRQSEHQVLFEGPDPSAARPWKCTCRFPYIRIPEWSMCQSMEIDSLAHNFQSGVCACYKPDIRIPEWFTHRSEETALQGLVAHNFRIDFPGNFKWEDKGLAFCASTYFNPTSAAFLAHMRRVRISINGVSIIDKHRSERPLHHWWWTDVGFVWLYYIPFDAIIKRLSESGLQPPSVCRIKFGFELEFVQGRSSGLVNCGVHVVMPEDEAPFVNWVLQHQLDNDEGTLGHHHQISTDSVVNFLKQALRISLQHQFLERILASSTL